MKLGIVIYSNDAESVWNAFRFGAFACKKGDEVKIFLLGKGVEAEGLDIAQFNITEQMAKFVEAGGEILACGTCLKLRQSEGSEMCPLSTLEDLYRIVAESDRVLSF
jgi:uncharacterized protein involved in oxidation of intracellular sulfur